MEAAAPGADVELMCKTLQVDHKLFYFDFKENPRGHYLKISEKTSGSRSTIIVPMAGVVWFVDLFNYYANGEDPEFFSKELQLDTKVFYFDVSENQRGRFLKLATGHAEHMGDLGDAIGAGFMPTSSPPVMSAISSVAADMEFPNVASSATAEGGTVTPHVMQAEQKKFFFDLGINAHGQYLRISEVTGVDRSAIILPALALEKFHETLGQFVDMVKSQCLVGSGEANVHTIAPR
ncbi:hypothetical protein BDL97_10G024300 [Sphagnum fallax]|nr:hypothetical protein BDL97_10G024300 [Sphagnum fallax]KAH8949277.1 hypothetical protein BDL97_10G024300 [Sphagnum fallax]